MKLLLSACLLIFAQVALANPMTGDEEFLAAREAFRTGDLAQLDRLAESLAHSPLEPYVSYYQLRLRLSDAHASAIQQFLARPADTPMIDRLRGEWLKYLGKTQQWDAFEQEYPHLITGDVELNCYALQIQSRKQPHEALLKARQIWFSSEELPESCNPLFVAAIADGSISEQDIWQRIRLTLETGNESLARQIAASLPDQRILPAGELKQAHRDPERYLRQLKLKHSSLAQRTIALFALQRLAKQSPQLAYTRWTKIAAYFPEADQHYFYGWLGYEAARKQDARALNWFLQAWGTQLSTTQLAWRTRAALREQNWHEVWVSIQMMDPLQQRESAWRYWKARALKALGMKLEADALLTAQSMEHNFYGQLAAEELGAVLSTIQAADYLPSQEEIEAIQALPGIQRALALYRMDLNSEAFSEWGCAVSKFNDKQLLAAAEVARRNGIYDRAIATAERTVQLHDFNLRYPTPYRTELEGHIRDNKLDEAWVYGLMRQESRFVIQAKSDAGAIGLMQIMPATARWAAHQLGMKHFRSTLSQQLETNLKLGTFYLKTVSSQFNNNPVLASAAYNAGPARARQWLADTPLEGAIYIETIPFDETRDYVKKVMSNTVYYSKLFGQPASPLKQRLGVLEPM